MGGAHWLAQFIRIGPEFFELNRLLELGGLSVSALGNLADRDSVSFVDSDRSKIWFLCNPGCDRVQEGLRCNLLTVPTAVHLSYLERLKVCALDV
jgi:hypothetical protein